MKNLIPDIIEQDFLKGKSSNRAEAAVLFIDLSGFTQLTEKLMLESKSGAEKLSEIINGLFTPLIRQVYGHEGFISGFAGDAFTAIFMNESCRESAAVCAVGMLDSINNFGSSVEREEGINVSAKIGLSFGNIEWGIVGKTPKNSYYFRGKAIDSSAAAEHHAGRGEIVCDSSFTEPAVSHFVLDKMDEGYFLLRGAADKKMKAFGENEKTISDDVLRIFLPHSSEIISARGEFRDIVTLFLSFKDDVDIEEMKEVCSTILEEASSAGGYYSGFDFGDKGGNILILFGAPLSYENNLERAVFLFGRLKSLLKEKVRGGITEGTVFAGFIGSSLRATYTVLGRNVNLSARMMMSTDWGECTVSERVFEMLKWTYDFIPLGEKKFKGISEAGRIFKLGEKRKRNALSEIFFENEMVGREGELEKVSLMAENILHGTFGGLCYIYGEAGIGKSRLLFEVITAFNGKAETILLKTDEMQIKSLHPVKTFFGMLFNQAPETGTSENRKRFDEAFDSLSERLLVSAGNSDMKASVEHVIMNRELFTDLLGLTDYISDLPEKDRKERFESLLFALKEFFKAYSALNPVIIAVEDMQYLDSDTKRLISMMTRRMDNFPILFILTARPDDKGDFPMIEGAEEVNSHKFVLERLPKESVEQFISGQLIYSPSKMLTEGIFARTEGNPFYVEQFCLYLIENDLLEMKGDEHFMKTGEMRIPEGITSLLISRLDRLAAELKQIVQTASVLGKEFEISVLSKMLMEEDVSWYLSIGVAERIWSAVNEIKYIFKHSLMRDAAYSMQLKARLRKMHEMAADAVKTVYGSNPAKAGDIAYHYEMAVMHDSAAEYYYIAGEHAARSYFNENAVTYYSKCMEFAKDRKMKLKSAYLMIKAMKMAGQWSEIAGICTKLISEMKVDDDKELVCDIHNIYAIHLKDVAKYEESLMITENAMKIAEKEGIERIIEDSMQNIAEIKWRLGKYDEALEILNGMLKKVGGSGRLIEGIYCMDKANILKDRGMLADAWDYYQKAYDIVLRQGSKSELVGILGNMGLIKWMQGDYDGAMYYYDINQKYADEMGSKQYQSYVYGNKGGVYFYKGDFDAAAENFSKQLVISEELGELRNMRIALNNLGAICEMKGEYEREIEYFTRSLDVAVKLGDKMGQRVVLSNLGNIYAIKGDFEKARGYFNDSMKIGEDLGDKRGLVLVRGNIGMLDYLEGDLGSAEENLKFAIENAQSLKLEAHIPKYSYKLARIYFVQGRKEESRFYNNIAFEKRPDTAADREESVNIEILQKLLDSEKGTVESLLEMLSTEKEDIGRAFIEYELFWLTGERKYADSALKYFENVIVKYDNFYYRNICEELKSGERRIF